MKLRNKIAAITAAAMLAFTGVGFAAWTFTNSVVSTSPAFEPEVVCAVELNSPFEMYTADGSTKIENLYLIMDAPAATEHHLGGNGIYWSTSKAENKLANKIENVCIKGTLHYDAKDIADLASVTVGFTKGNELTDTTYVNFGSLATISDVTVAVADNAEVNTGSFALPTVAYTSAVDEFDAVADLANLKTGLTSLSISYTAQIKSQTLKA